MRADTRSLVHSVEPLEDLFNFLAQSTRARIERISSWILRMPLYSDLVCGHDMNERTYQDHSSKLVKTLKSERVGGQPATFLTSTAGPAVA